MLYITSVPPLQEIRDAFSRALRAPVLERENILEGLTPEVRDEVLSLLSAHDAAGTFLAEPNLDLSARTRIGPYLLVDRIGQGGMGVVFRAVHADREFKREVAIKVVGGGAFAPETERRFIRERRILAVLDHPNIVRMLDGGISNGTRYLVMELVSGQAVTDYCRERSFSMKERVRLFRTICSAIQYAHQRMILHRDLKSGNILVTQEGQVKVLDFGIAQLLEGDGMDGVSTTALHPMTLSCASPEQVREERLTLASDIYALGLLLCELLTGKNPQSIGTRAEVIQYITTAEPTPLAKLANDIPADLDAIVRKALARDPARRYASAEEFSADLGRFLENRPVLARPELRWHSFYRFCARNKWISGLAAALVIAVLAGLAGFSWQARRAERRFNDVRSLAHSILFEVYDSVSAIPGSLPARRLLANSAQQYLDRLAAEAVNDSSLGRELAEAYLRLGDVQGRPYIANLGDIAGALANYRKGQALLEKAFSSHPGDRALRNTLAHAYMNVSVILMRQKRGDEAIASAQRAIELMEPLSRQDPTNAAYNENLSHAYMRLGQAQNVLANQKDSTPLFWTVLATYRKALAIQLESGVDKTQNPWKRRLSSNYFYVGYALRSLGDRTGDVSLYHEALESSLKGDEINRQLAAASGDVGLKRNLADGLGDIARLRWRGLRDFQGAIRDAREALSTFESIAAADPQNLEARRDVASAYENVGLILGDAGGELGRVREAISADRKALNLYEQLGRADPTSGENAASIRDVAGRIAALENSRSSQH